MYSENIITVSTRDPDREIRRHRRWVKQIDGKWYYKDTNDVKISKMRTFYPVDGHGEVLHDWEDVEFDD